VQCRYLYGPVTTTFAADHLRGPRAAGACLAFDAAGATDLAVGVSDTWEDVCRRFPPDWQPDFVVLDLHYTQLPACLWTAPVPLVGLAADANWLWHHYRHRLACCELVLTDTASAEALSRAGVTAARAANLFGCAPSSMENPAPESPRDIDILFCGNLQQAIQRERLPWLGRLGPLGTRWRVVIATGIFGDEYRRLLGRARVVFNRSARGESNLRTMEGVAAGALLFQEADNREVSAYFRDGQECVFYTADDLEERLTYYLEHEEVRAALAAAARAKLPQYTWEALWQGMLGLIEQEWDGIAERTRSRSVLTGRDSLLARTAEALAASTFDDPTLVADLEAAVQQAPGSAALHNALGLAWTRASQGAGPVTAELAGQAAAHFRRAVEADPTHLLAGLNLAEALVGIDHKAEAAEAAARTLAELSRQPELDLPALDGGHFPPAFDHFRVEWEGAGWQHAGDPAAEAAAKRDLLRWRLHSLLADLTGELTHYEEAAATRPDLPLTQAALGCAHGRAGRPELAVGPLARAVAGNPFDLRAAGALYRALGETGDRDGQRRLAADRRLLAQAAPQVVPVEPWFAPQPVPGPGKPTRVQTLSLDDFRRRFGAVDASRAICAYTPPVDTQVVLTLLAHARPKRVLEVGTALGHITANLTEWTADDAQVVTIGTVADLGIPTSAAQRYEDPSRADFARAANHFGKVGKVLFVTADSLGYDFARLGPLDFAFLDGAHDRAHVRGDTLGVYRQLRAGGWLVWHDFASPVSWVEVRQAVEEIGFAEPVTHVAGTGVAFLCKGEAAGPPANGAPVVQALVAPTVSGNGQATPAAPVPQGKLAVVWEGPLLEVQSLALVNRQLCQRLIGRGHELSLLPLNFPEGLGVPTVSGAPALTERIGRPLGRPADAHVRHRWPPDFQPPAAGHAVTMLHWEFGSPPRDWIGPLNELSDEVWVGSRFVRDCLVQGGASADRLHLIPLGVDPQVFRPEAPPLPLRTTKPFKFLFVGGTIPRNGIDLLLDAYTRTFRATDGVCLVVKDMGAGSFYKGQTAEARIAACRAQAGAPEIEYLDGPLSEAQLAGLYTACDCLVLPYRGEGFGLPLAEAMACGRPVVVTGQGAALDFCGPDNAYLVPSRTVRLTEKRVGSLETVDYPWWAEPDVEELARLLRRALECPAERQVKGAAGRARILAGFTWDHAAAAVEERLLALRQRPVRRLVRPLAGLPSAQPPTPQRRMRVSLCIIVRNEEANLAACLGPLVGLFDEIIVVDTGSTDRTKEIAAQLGAKVFDFPWCDSFAAARNACLDRATGDWIFWMDADDRLDQPNCRKLGALLASLRDENAVYAMECVCLPDRPGGTATAVTHVRLFRRDPDLRWDYRVHEQILPAARRSNADIRFCDVAIHHVGYQDPDLRLRKLDRDLRLLELDRAERPDDAFVHFNLGFVYNELGRPEEALAVLRHSLAAVPPDATIVRKLYALLVACHRKLGQQAEAVAACREGRGRYPEDAELLFLESQLLTEHGDRPGAIASLERLLGHREAAHFASVDTGVRGPKARHNLALLYREEGRHADAGSQWQQALTEQPCFVPALLGLGELALAGQRWAEVEQLAAWLAGAAEAPLEAGVLKARGHLARREFAEARRLLEEVIGRYPREVWPRVILSHTLLQEGRDWEAAEQALRDVLALDAQHAEARRNLGILLRQLKRPSDESWAEGTTLARLYEAACTAPSDLREHLPALYELASRRRHVTELGGAGPATKALLFAQPDQLDCYGPRKGAEVYRLQALAGRTLFHFHKGDLSPADIAETDLLLVHADADRAGLAELLRRHAGRVRQYLVLHRAPTFAQREGTGEGKREPAVEVLLGAGSFRLGERSVDRAGLTVLEAVRP
jgi:glycosyltransferase involved in cell wall biosynthesis/predicted Zn-dependent protease/predicted O-methyltransferase YrrM